MGIALFMTCVFFVAIGCGIATYRVSIREARKEIDDAFQQHIKSMHTSHKKFVETIKSDREG